MKLINNIINNNYLKHPLRLEHVIIIISLYFSIFLNHGFWKTIVDIQHQLLTNKYIFLSNMLLIVILLQLAVLTLISLIAWGKYFTKYIIILLIGLTVIADYFAKYYAVYFNREMIVNILHTNFTEAIELFNFTIVLYYLKYGFLPSIIVLFGVNIKPCSFIKHLIIKILLFIFYISLGLLLICNQFKEVCIIIKYHKEIKYQLLPASLLISSARFLAVNSKNLKINQPLLDIDTKATKTTTCRRSRTPTTLVLVLGETVRANNWGLSGYYRQTTPELIKLPIINFPYAIACGTNTEISLPCMFSPYGRNSYNAEKIRSTESVLHLFNKMNIDVVWIDNQSGCKGVCNGLRYIEAKTLNTDITANYSASDKCLDVAMNCSGTGNCLDEILIAGLESHIIINPDSKKDQILILHQLGNHGPGYFARYPKEFNRFTPTCNSYDLTKCNNIEIVNAYDNAILYTDWIIAEIIKKLTIVANNINNNRNFILLYVSDHGESLGENNLYLHGIPYAIAPIEQTRVPMVLWFSKNFPINKKCIINKAKNPAHHDNIYHTLMKIFSIQSYTYKKELDLLEGCYYD